jgi:uncharacterized protein YqeY
MAPGDAEDIRTRLRRALPPAMKARDRTTVAALRSALAAIDNAEAVEVTNTPPPGPAPSIAADQAPPAAERSTPASEGTPVAGAVLGLGAGEVERRKLTAAEMEAIVRREVADRRSAARAYQGAGQSGHAQRLRAEADLLGSYLDDPDTPT